MDKGSEIKLVGQSIFKQISDLLSVINPEALIKKHKAARYYKSFKTKQVDNDVGSIIELTAMKD